jgi:hypothetical protein
MKLMLIPYLCLYIDSIDKVVKVEGHVSKG